MTDTPHFPALTAIAGGIGSGKSVVARAVAAMGCEVYDCDLRARALMESLDMRRSIADEFGACVIADDGFIDRRALSAIVFADAFRLDALNRIVHGAVRLDLAAWARAPHGGRRLFVETAILYQSRLDRMVGRVWEVTAPTETRIARVAARNGLSRREIMARIASQDAFEVASPHPRTAVIVNDGILPLLPQIEALM